MKNLFIFLICLLPVLVMCTTRTVSLDGTQQYLSIQEAVDASVNGDVVLVYPGRYVENINLLGQSISLVSLFATDPLQSYIENTVIDGNLNTCIRVVNGETLTISGITLVNNEQGNYSGDLSYAGGGIYLKLYSQVIVNDCIIRNCIAQSGGGISVSRHSNLSLSNVKIFDNQALTLGGGIAFDESDALIFDPVALCSVYNNSATRGMDISFTFHYETQNSYSVNLLRGSSVLSEPDGYFIGYRNCNVSLNIQQGYITQIDSDLYVSPDGDDANTGLSAESPMQSIVYAMQRIASNSASPRTIYLAEGTYSNSCNNQLFPAGVKSHVRVIGAGMDDTVLDCEFLRTALNAWYADDIEIANMKIVNCRSSYTFPLGVLYGSDIYLRDLKFENNYGSLSSGLTIGYCDNIIIENIIAGNTTYHKDLMTIKGFECDNLLINNFISAYNTITDWEYNKLGLNFSSCDLILRNSIIANNYAQDAWPFFYTNIYPGFEDFNLDMSNVLIINNTMYDCSWVDNPIYMQNRFQPMQINNCTFANNSANASLTSIIGGAEIRNLVSYNPGTPYELYLNNYISNTGLSYEASISNSLFRSGTVGSSLPDLVTLTDNIMNSDPLFLGTVDTNLSIDQPEYYQLSSLSPCIDSGTPDLAGMNLAPMDLAGNDRVWNGRIDMGCYEYGSKPYVGIDDPELPPPPDRILISAYPNPLFNTSKAAGVFIEFTLPGKPAAEPVLDIFNVRGQKVKTMRLTESYNSLIHKAGLAGDVKQNGEFYSTVWNGKDDRNRPLASGTYIVKVRADRMVATTKITIIK
ncbi:MAG: hypothetical protein LHW56_02755 [Candidatus Cloacimonetes bacterium]|nr:hypothetical protein [Candidatus Cloacimonadota bacterium]MDY0171807.1 choice-of-anchor Q domain-containing protein [Candidatus Cloacimonadaceae bacterium]